jgi:hypothetical protein
MPVYYPPAAPSISGGGISLDGANAVLFEEFSNVPNSASIPFGPFGFLSVNSGSGANIAAIAATDANTFGLAQLTTGTTTTGAASIYGVAANGVRFGGGAYTLACRFQMPTLVDGTDSGNIHLGFGDNAGGAATDGVYLYWDNTQTNFRYRTRNNSTQTDVDSGLPPVAATWYYLQIAMNAAGTSVTFTLGTANFTSNSQTITTNIPTAAGRETGLIAQIIKSAGTSPRLLYLDYIRLALAMTSRI